MYDNAVYQALAKALINERNGFPALSRSNLTRVKHYDQFFGLCLSDQQKKDLVEYLKSLYSVAP